MGTHVNDWRGLEQFGIILLTGEACGLNMRGLCDLTETGAETVREFFGMHRDAKLGENWNHGSDTNPHVASIMLPYELLPSLAAFCMCRASYGDVVFSTQDNSVHSYTQTEWRDVAINVPSRYIAGASITLGNDEYTWTRLLELYGTEEAVCARARQIEIDAYLCIRRYYKRSSAPGNGLRNQHAMSGRVE